MNNTNSLEDNNEYTAIHNLNISEGVRIKTNLIKNQDQASSFVTSSTMKYLLIEKILNI